MKSKITIFVFLSIILNCSTIYSQSIENSFPVNTTVPKGGSILNYVPISGTPSNAAIVNVEAKFTYTAFNGVQNYVSARFARGGDPGTSGGVQLLAQGSLPAGNPGTYGYVSLGNFGNSSPNSNYYFRIFYSSSSPYTFLPTISTIYVRVTYAVIDVTYPSGGQTFYKNYSFPINWTSTNLSSTVDIHLYKGGSFNSVIANGVSNSGSYNFTVPVTLSNASDYSIGVSALSGHTYDFTNNFTISSGTLTVTNPTSGTVWTMGSNYNISWTGSNINDLVAIDLYKGGTNLSRLTSSAPSSGTFSYTVPTNLTAGSDYRIGISTFSGYVSNFSSYFTVNALPPPIPTLTYPPNNAVINDLTPDLAWNASGASSFWGQVSTNSSFTSIVAENTNIGSFNWTPSLSLYTTYYWRVKARGSGGSLSEWSSIWSFTVANTPSLISPSSGSTVTSSAFIFQWSDCNAVRYELLVDNNNGFGSAEISKYNINELGNYHGTSYQISGNWLEENVYYWKVYAVYSDSSKVQSAIGSFTYSPDKSPSPVWVPVYRAYKPTDVDHFYCTSESHLFQAYISGYDFEKVDGYVSLTPFQSPYLKSIFRFNIKNQKSHIYTTNPSTKDSLIAADVLNNIYEGIIGYAYGSQQPGLVKFYYTYLGNGTPALIDHFYTISDVEKNNSIHNGYNDRGFIAYVSPFGDESTEPWMEMQPEYGYGINPQNGNVGSYNKTSFNIPGARTSLSFAHIYNSYSTRLMSQVNSIGAGWSHSYKATLSTMGDKIYVIWPGGGVHAYKISDLTPVTKGLYDVLTKLSPTKYQIKKKDQFVYTFDILNAGLDSTAFLTSIKDRNNNTINISYNVQLRRLDYVESLPDGRRLNFYYYPDAGKTDLIQEVRDPANRILKFEYDNDKNLIKFTDAKNQVTQYQYVDSTRYDHLLKKIIFPKGNFIENVFSGKKIIYQKNSNNTNLSLQYNSSSTTITDQNSKVFELFYTSQKAGLLSSLVRGSVRDSLEYSDIQNPTKPTKIIDGRAFVTTISYDTKGNTLQVNKPENAVHKFIYNSFNDVTQYTDPRNKITYYGYNATGNLISVSNSRGSTGITYNPNGTINTTTDPLSRVTTLGYNSFGNVSAVTDYMNHQTSYIYDNISRLISMTDANGKTTNYTKDNNDLVTLISKPNSTNTNYTYDANDNLYTVSNPNSNVTTFNHNDKDLLQSVINPLSNQVSYDYNDNGSLRQKTLPDNQTILYSYDNFNRLQTISGAITGNLIYDNSDNIITATNSSGALNYNYDGLNRITSYSDYYGNTVSYGYDLSGNITSITYPGNKVVQYTYYDDNLLRTVKDWYNNVTTYIYRNDGSVQEVQYPNGTKKTYTYDAAGRVTGIANKKSDGSTICQYIFTLDNLGNHLSVTQTEPYTTPPVNSASRNFTYNTANRVTSEGVNTYSYTANGNLFKKLGSDTINYGFDAENRLINMSGKYTAGFNYDLSGNRRYSDISGNVKKYVLDINTSLAKVLMETNNNGDVLNYYVYGLELISKIKPDGTTNYYHSDFRGSVVAMTNASQVITHKYSYGAFGEILKQYEADPNPFKYVGAYGVMDDGDGLYYMRARYYDPKIGRFISEDPVWDVNLYTYGENNPLMNLDPNGMKTSYVEQFIKFSFNMGTKTEDLMAIAKIDGVTMFDKADFAYNLFRVTRYFYENITNPNGKTTESLTDMFFASFSMLGTVTGYGLAVDFIEMEYETYKSIMSLRRELSKPKRKK